MAAAAATAIVGFPGVGNTQVQCIGRAMSLQGYGQSVHKVRAGAADTADAGFPGVGSTQVQCIGGARRLA